MPPGVLVPLGLVVLVPEGRGISGIGTTVGRVLEEVPGFTVDWVVLPMLRQPVKMVAVKTNISVTIHAFFISDPPVFRNTSLVFLRYFVLHPEISYKKIVSSFFGLLFFFRCVIMNYHKNKKGYLVL